MFISLETYLMGRDKNSPVSEEQLRNTANLLARVNMLLGLLTHKATVSSGYRPLSINSTVGGSKNSTHLLCMGVDLVDSDGYLANTILNDLSILEVCDLYLENPKFTKGWVHLDIRKRDNRVFNP